MRLGTVFGERIHVRRLAPCMVFCSLVYWLSSAVQSAGPCDGASVLWINVYSDQDHAESALRSTYYSTCMYYHCFASRRRTLIYPTL